MSRPNFALLGILAFSFMSIVYPRKAHTEEAEIVQRFANVTKAFDLDIKNWLLKHARAKSPEESASRYDEFPLWSYIPKVLAIADEDKEGRVLIDIAEWITVNAGRVGIDDTRMYEADAKIMTLLKVSSLDDERLMRLLAKIGDHWSPACEALLRSCVAEGEPDRMKGVACIALAMQWRQLKESSESQASIENANRLGSLDVFTLHVKSLRSSELESQLKDAEFIKARSVEAERLLDQAKHEFADVPFPSDRYQGTVGDMVALLREGSLPSPLGVGSNAPPIEGIDLQGNLLKLSDYRGQIVVINFWASNCVPCLRKIGPLNSFAEKYPGDVVVLGVNTDSDLENALLASKKHATTWRSWHDSSLSEDSIARRYKVASNPCVFVLDENGVIRSNKTSELSDIEVTVQELLKNRAGKR